MSEEPAQPSLRLKPRQTPPPAAPEASALPDEVPAEPAVESSPAGTDPFRLRLKPKTPPPAGSPDPALETPVPFSAPPMPPVESIPVAAEASVETSPEPVLPEAIPVPAAKSAQYSPPPPQYVPAPRGMADPSGPSGKAPASTIKADKWLAGLVLFVLVLVAAFYGVRLLLKAHPKPVSNKAAQAAVAPTDAPAASNQSAPKLVEKPVSAAGKAIAKARDVIAAKEKAEKEQGVTGLLEDSTPAAGAKASPATPQIVAPAEGAQPATPAAPAAPEPPPPPSDAFRSFITNLRVSGVFQGENARALINGRMYHLGGVIDPVRKIEFYKIDPEAKQLIFRDDTGAIVYRHY